MFTSASVRMFEALRGLLVRTRDEDGQTLAEYGLIVTLIAVAVTVLALIVFRGALIDSFSAATNCLNGSC